MLTDESGFPSPRIPRRRCLPPEIVTDLCSVARRAFEVRTRSLSKARSLYETHESHALYEYQNDAPTFGWRPHFGPRQLDPERSTNCSDWRALEMAELG